VIPRLVLHPGARARLALAGGVLLLLGLALAPGGWASGPLRAAAVVGALGAAALLTRTGPGRAAPARLALVARQALSREVGVALLEIDGRAVLVGFGGGGVRLLEPVPASPPSPEPRP
jgi:flagellar protein FliO/FliZ